MKPSGSILTAAHSSKLSLTQTPKGPDASHGRLRVDHAPRMRCRRVHPLRVKLDLAQPVAAAALTAAGPLSVRPVLPGCLVVPEELSVNPGEAATFQVTPLARGDLRDARLEIDWAGQRLPACPLSVRGTSETPAWVLAILTLVLPIFWCYITGHAGLTSPLGVRAADGPLATVLRQHLPPFGPVTSGLATVLQQVFDLMAAAEQTFRLGFLFAAVLLTLTVLAVLAQQVKVQRTFGPPLPLGPSTATASTRSHVPPPYLTPVSPDEINLLRRG